MKSTVCPRRCLVGALLLLLLLHFTHGEEGREKPLVADADSGDEGLSIPKEFYQRVEVPSVKADNKKIEPKEGDIAEEWKVHPVGEAEEEGKRIPAATEGDGAGKIPVGAADDPVGATVEEGRPVGETEEEGKRISAETEGDGAEKIPVVAADDPVGATVEEGRPVIGPEEKGDGVPAEAEGDGAGKIPVGAAADERDTEEDRAKFVFIKGYSTQTHTIVSFSTSTVPLTCFGGYSPVTPAVCMGRRRKRSVKRINRILAETSSEVESSQDLSSTSEVHVADKGRKFFTVWTKSFTTTTLTSISTDSATTLSLSYYCSAGNIDIPNIGCG